MVDERIDFAAWNELVIHRNTSLAILDDLGADDGFNVCWQSLDPRYLLSLGLVLRVEVAISRDRLDWE